MLVHNIYSVFLGELCSKSIRIAWHPRRSFRAFRGLQAAAGYFACWHGGASETFALRFSSLLKLPNRSKLGGSAQGPTAESEVTQP